MDGKGVYSRNEDNGARAPISLHISHTGCNRIDNSQMAMTGKVGHLHFSAAEFLFSAIQGRSQRGDLRNQQKTNQLVVKECVLRSHCPDKDGCAIKPRREHKKRAIAWSRSPLPSSLSTLPSVPSRGSILCWTTEHHNILEVAWSRSHLPSALSLHFRQFHAVATYYDGLQNTTTYAQLLGHVTFPELFLLQHHNIRTIAWSRHLSRFLPLQVPSVPGQHHNIRTIAWSRHLSRAIPLRSCQFRAVTAYYDGQLDATTYAQLLAIPLRSCQFRAVTAYYDGQLDATTYAQLLGHVTFPDFFLCGPVGSGPWQHTLIDYRIPKHTHNCLVTSPLPSSLCLWSQHHNIRTIAWSRHLSRFLPLQSRQFRANAITYAQLLGHVTFPDFFLCGPVSSGPWQHTLMDYRIPQHTHTCLVTSPLPSSLSLCAPVSSEPTPQHTRNCLVTVTSPKRSLSQQFRQFHAVAAYSDGLQDTTTYSQLLGHGHISQALSLSLHFRQFHAVAAYSDGLQDTTTYAQLLGHVTFPELFLCTPVSSGPWQHTMMDNWMPQHTHNCLVTSPFPISSSAVPPVSSGPWQHTLMDYRIPQHTHTCLVTSPLPSSLSLCAPVSSEPTPQHTRNCLVTVTSPKRSLSQQFRQFHAVAAYSDGLQDTTTYSQLLGHGHISQALSLSLHFRQFHAVAAYSDGLQDTTTYAQLLGHVTFPELFLCTPDATTYAQLLGNFTFPDFFHCGPVSSGPWQHTLIDYRMPQHTHNCLVTSPLPSSLCGPVSSGPWQHTLIDYRMPQHTHNCLVTVTSPSRALYLSLSLRSCQFRPVAA
ncbi:hypothetical protein J6590_085636 [Homalodisca vitripennis]|nr:hypothetical protein J6590_085636 [Homalodisca vitripennis]